MIDDFAACSPLLNIPVTIIRCCLLSTYYVLVAGPSTLPSLSHRVILISRDVGTVIYLSLFGNLRGPGARGSGLGSGRAGIVTSL